MASNELMQLSPDTIRTALIDLGAWDAADPRNPAVDATAAVHLARRFLTTHPTWLLCYYPAMTDNTGIACEICHLEGSTEHEVEVATGSHAVVRKVRVAAFAARDSFARATTGTILAALLQCSTM